MAPAGLLMSGLLIAALFGVIVGPAQVPASLEGSREPPRVVGRGRVGRRGRLAGGYLFLLRLLVRPDATWQAVEGGGGLIEGRAVKGRAVKGRAVKGRAVKLAVSLPGFRQGPGRGHADQGESVGGPQPRRGRAGRRPGTGSRQYEPIRQQHDRLGSPVRRRGE
jgi:hypothetical protein